MQHDLESDLDRSAVASYRLIYSVRSGSSPSELKATGAITVSRDGTKRMRIDTNGDPAGVGTDDVSVVVNTDGVFYCLKHVPSGVTLPSPSCVSGATGKEGASIFAWALGLSTSLDGALSGRDLDVRHAWRAEIAGATVRCYDVTPAADPSAQTHRFCFDDAGVLMDLVIVDGGGGHTVELTAESKPSPASDADFSLPYPVVGAD
jgi:hypothetical protein